MSTKFKGTVAERRALNALICLMRASQAVSTVLAESIHQHSLTSAQFGVLEALYHCGPLRLGELAGKVLSTCGNITVIVDNLEKQSLVTRVREEKDRRAYKVVLEKSGSDLIRKILPPHVETIVERFSVLTAEEQEELRRLCRTLGRSIKPPPM